ASPPRHDAGMDAWRLGRVVWSLRHRLGWQQGDLAKRARTSQSAISRIERGHGDRIPLCALRTILEQLDAEVGYEVRWRAGALDRLLDERHARLVGLATQLLVGAGWEMIPELTYSTYGERGSIDLLGWSAASRHLIVVEVKTELVSVEATLRKLDEKVRLAPAVARERLGWQAEHVSRL